MDANGCSQCLEGFVAVTTFPAVYGGKTPIETFYACACTTGRRRLAHTQGIERVISMDEFERRYPDGFPQHDTKLLEILTAANVPPACQSWTIASYQQKFASMGGIDEVLKRAHAWIHLPVAERSDWVMLGPNGTGKTGLAIALVRSAAEQGQSVQFWTVKHLSIVWRASYDAQLFERRDDTRREVELLDAIVAPDVVVLDEFGGTNLTDFIESTITLIVDARQKALRPTILTCNLTDEDMVDKKSINGRVTQLLGPTLMDRLRERAQWLPLKGSSHRRAWRPA